MVLAILAGLERSLECFDRADGGLVGAPLTDRSGFTEEGEYGEVTEDDVVIDLDGDFPLTTQRGFLCTGDD